MLQFFGDLVNRISPVGGRGGLVPFFEMSRRGLSVAVAFSIATVAIVCLWGVFRFWVKEKEEGRRRTQSCAHLGSQSELEGKMESGERSVLREELVHFKQKVELQDLMNEDLEVKKAELKEKIKELETQVEILLTEKVRSDTNMQGLQSALSILRQENVSREEELARLGEENEVLSAQLFRMQRVTVERLDENPGEVCAACLEREERIEELEGLLLLEKKRKRDAEFTEMTALNNSLVEVSKEKEALEKRVECLLESLQKQETENQNLCSLLVKKGEEIKPAEVVLKGIEEESLSLERERDSLKTSLLNKGKELKSLERKLKEETEGKDRLLEEQKSLNSQLREMRSSLTKTEEKSKEMKEETLQNQRIYEELLCEKAKLANEVKLLRQKVDTLESEKSDLEKEQASRPFDGYLSGGL